MAINNRYEFVFYIQCVDCNPNGDPDLGNQPRMDPQDFRGYITDGAQKRRIRNYIQTAYQGQLGMDIMVQNGTNINRFIAQAKESAGVTGKTRDAIYKARQAACAMFYDVRTFGAVMSTGPDAGQVRGPVQFTFAKSIDAILPQDISITRMANAKNISGDTVADYEKWEDAQDYDTLRTMGRKQFISYGLYEARGFISANLAGETGFGESDLHALCEAILSMYEHDRSASKGMMSVVSPVILFQHVGTDSDETQRARQAKLGCAPAHKLFSLVNVVRKPEVAVARDYTDYTATIALDRVPQGVRVGFMSDPYGEISWDTLPADCTWLIHA